MAVNLGLLVAVALVALCGGACAKVLPDYIYVCKAGHAQYSECLQKTIESIRPRLAKGISRLHVPALEPLVVRSVEFQAGLENINGRVKMTNVRAFGPTSFVVNSLKVDPVGLSAKVSVTFPALSGEGEYDVDGRLLSFSMKSRGFARANFTNVRSDVRGTGKVVEKDGVKHLVIDKIQSKTRLLGESKVKLVSGDPNSVIVDTFNNFFHENKQLIYEVVYPLLDETVDDLIVQIANDILSRIPLEEMLPN